MRLRTCWWLSLCGAGLAGSALAADHAESPLVTADPAADIADVYIFRPDPALPILVAAMTFAGRPCTAAGAACGTNAGGMAAVGGTNRIDATVMRCDPNVLYAFNIDNNADGNLDATPDIRVFARLARNGNGQCGVQIENVPGLGGRLISGREGTIITDSASGLRAFAGLIEDPFVFDTPGFGMTLASLATPGPNGTIAFSNQRDGFGGRNISVIVFEMNLDALAGGDAAASPTVQFWGDTFRFPGTQP